VPTPLRRRLQLPDEVEANRAASDDRASGLALCCCLMRMCGLTVQFQRSSHVDFTNPDLVKYAESFGAAGYRVTGPGQLQGILKKALLQPTVTTIDCPVDYSENLKLTEQLGNLVCPI